MGSGCIDARFFDFGIRWRWVVSLMSLPPYSLRNSPGTLNRKLGGPQNRPGRRREEKNPWANRDTKSDPSVVQPILSLYTGWNIPSPPSQNLVLCFFKGTCVSVSHTRDGKVWKFGRQTEFGCQRRQSYWHVIEWLFGFWVGNWFIEHLQIVTSSHYIAIANSHSLKLTTLRIKTARFSISSPVVAW
jgi:hypothetical protein